MDALYLCQTVPLYTEGPHWCRATVYQEEDWVEAVPQLVDPVACEPVDITGWVFSLFVRPTYGYEPPPILSVVSGPVSGDRIVIEDAAEGLISIFVDQATIVALPSGEWEQYLTFTYTDATLGSVHKTLWRGPFIIRPGHRDLV